MNVTLVAPQPRPFNSLRYEAEVVKIYFDVGISPRYVKGSKNVRIGDLKIDLTAHLPYDVLWSDTPLVIETAKTTPQGEIYAVCDWNRKQLEQLGYVVSGTIPRLINPLAFKLDAQPKTFDFAAMGHYRGEDRKNLRMMRRLNCDVQIFTDAIFIMGKQRAHMAWGRTSEEDKFRWLASARFLLHIPYSGGFEMPCFEAMALGVPLVYSDIPPINEYAVGVPVRAGAQTIGRCDMGKIYKWDIQATEVETATKTALNMSKEQYADMSAKAKARAVIMRDVALMTLSKVLNS